MMTQINHFWFSSFLHLYSLYFSCILNNKSACLFYNVGNIFPTTCFKHFVLMELYSSNSNFNNLFESSSIEDFLVNSLVDSLFDSLMCLNISF